MTAVLQDKKVNYIFLAVLSSRDRVIGVRVTKMDRKGNKKIR